ncbi:MAG: dienelactone hydrolase family protein [Usitatibacter sp.]
MKSPTAVRWLAALAATAFVCAAAEAKVVTKTIPYQHEGKTMQGFLAYDDAKAGPRPGILVINEWWGLNDYAKSRTRQLAEMGYVAFAADMYGDGKTTRDPKEAQAWSSAAGSQPGALAAASKAGLDVLSKQPQANASELAAIGFCFGGTTVLQLAYAGTPLKGAVTFHGGLVVPDEAQAAKIRTPILVLHGAEDTFIKPETIAGLQKSLDAAKVDWYMVTYAQAVHAFTNPDADSFKIPGIGYNEKAAKRSWDEMKRFFDGQFAKK